ncbi:MAG: hypothetical protein CL930_10570 [Deltaproteobacteria bacterium]|nr:hypothetical protein [Deltaproteobacteria bacterium]
MPGNPKHEFLLRLILATILALCVPWILGPEDTLFRYYNISLAFLTVLAGLLRSRTNEGGLLGQMATGGMALLMFTPAVGIRTSRVAEAVFKATHIAPHEALFQLPTIAQTVPDASGPLLLGAGLAILTLCGRLGATYGAIALCAAAGAWAGHGFASDAGVAMHAERFEQAVLRAQSMRFVGFTVLIGAIIGHFFTRKGNRDWLMANRALILKQRTDKANRIRQAELDRMAKVKATISARIAAEDARKAKEEEEALQGVTIEGLDGEAPEQISDEDAPPIQSDDLGEGGGFSEEDGDFEDVEDDSEEDAAEKEQPTTENASDAADDPQDPDADDTDNNAKAQDTSEQNQDGAEGQESDAKSPVPEPAPETFEEEIARLEQEMLPRFDVESPIVIEVGPEDWDPDHHLKQEVTTRYRRIITGLVIIACMTAGWTSTPPWFAVLNALPDPGTEIAVPFSDPGISIARTPMNPFHKNFGEQLENRGHGRLYGATWPCMSDTFNGGETYGSQGRGIESLAIPADTRVVDLYPAIIDMRKRGVYRMGLTGRAEPPYGPMGALFAWPAVQLLLDRPPRNLQWIKLHARHLEKLPLLPGRKMPTSCAILIDGEVTVDNLYSTTRSLGSVYGDKSCKDGIALVFPEDGSTTNSNPAWRGCP